MKKFWTKVALTGTAVLLVLVAVGCVLESEAATHEPETKLEQTSPSSLGAVTAATAATGAPLYQRRQPLCGRSRQRRRWRSGYLGHRDGADYHGAGPCNSELGCRNH